MMDIESTMRINELAKELTKKGFASSSEEASKMAEQFLQKNIIPKEHLTAPQGADKAEIQLERMQRKFNSDMSVMQEKMNSLINKLNNVCDEVILLKTREPQPKGSREIKKEDLQKTIVKKEESNQRTGAFKPGDIDINEVFYCGKKGQ